MMTVTLGMDCKLFRKNGSAFTAIDDVMNASLTLAKGVTEASTRGGNGWKMSIATLKEASISFDIIKRNGVPASVADFEAIRNNFIKGDDLELKAYDGPLSASQGLYAKWVVTKFDRKEDLESAVTYSCEVKPTLSDVTPSWMVNDAVYPAPPSGP